MSEPRSSAPALGFGVVVLLLLPASAAFAERKPSPELKFKVAIAPDSITVGDPIEVLLSAETPSGGVAALPALADSVGPFAVLDAGPIERSERQGRVTWTQKARVTLFETGAATWPALPLLWSRGDGDTLAAYSAAAHVGVRALLPAEAKGITDLRDVKGVVNLARELWWLWLLVAAAAGAVGYALWRRFRARRGVAPLEPIVLPKLPPAVAFEQGLDALLARGLIERGELKDYYVEVSQLLRRYLEDAYRFPAVEATRAEVLEEVGRRAVFTDSDRRFLAEWLNAGDLVKFAKGQRLLAEAKSDSDAARSWVREVDRRLPELGPITPPAALAASDLPATSAGGAR